MFCRTARLLRNPHDPVHSRPLPGGCNKGQACGLGYAGDTSQRGYYTLSITPVAGGIGSGFVLAGAPTAKGGQNGDSWCGAFTLSSTGARGFTGTGKLAECWP